MVFGVVPRARVVLGERAMVSASRLTEQAGVCSAVNRTTAGQTQPLISDL